MESFFDDPDVSRLPPAETRILNLCVEPSPDGRRLRVGVELTPFEQRPCLELTLVDPSGREVASASIIEPMNCKLELTLHIRKNTSPENYTLTARLIYPEMDAGDQRELTFVMPSTHPQDD